MIFKESTYNPLKNIFTILDGPIAQISALDEIKKELFLGGIVPENEDEFNTALELLVDFNTRK